MNTTEEEWENDIYALTGLMTPRDVKSLIVVIKFLLTKERQAGRDEAVDIIEDRATTANAAHNVFYVLSETLEAARKGKEKRTDTQ
jgi:hypothetical protein